MCPRFGFAGQLTNQSVEGLAHGRGQAGGDAVVQTLQDLTDDGGDQALERGAGGNDHLCRTEQGFRALDQVGSR